MNNSGEDKHIELPALRGDNPLGFLAALGVVTALHQTGEKEIRLSWKKRNVSWTPSVSGFIGDQDALVKKLAGALKGRTVSKEAGKEEQKAKKAFKTAKRNWNKAKKRKAEKSELSCLEEKRRHCEKDWQNALKNASESPELALGQRPDVEKDVYYGFAQDFLDKPSRLNRIAIDMLAAFGSDAVVARESNGKEKSQIEVTPFCFIKGSGNQFFLDTARILMVKVATREKELCKALFQKWDYRDETLSMRWDPLDDRRYALMDRDPTDEDNKSRTVWMANLLAYRALALFPSAPVKRQLKTTGWIRLEESKKKRDVFTWPIWDKPIGVETIRSLLQHSELAQKSPSLEKLMPLGVRAYFRSERIQAGNFFNFSPSAPV